MRENRVVKSMLLIVLSLVFTQAFSLRAAVAATNSEVPLVEINYPIDVMAPYKERRRTHAGNFGIRNENYVPALWESLIDEEYYDDTYAQTPIKLTSIEGGYKYNFILGSISLMGGIGYGEANTEFNGIGRKMIATKYFARGMFALDNILAEPYMVPYVAGSIWKMKIQESEDTTDFGGTFTSGFGFDYTLGLLLQLNWLDADFARESLNQNGIQNTYLDIFMTQYLKTLTSTDPILSSKLMLGLGLRLEF